MREIKISPGEFSAILFVSSISYIGTVSDNILGGNFSDAALATLLSTFVGWLLILPVLFLKKKENEKINILLLSVYLIFFVCTAVWEISSVVYMMQNTVFDTMNSWLFCVIFIAAAAYCGRLGLETVCRSAQIVIIATAVCGALILIAAVKHLEFDNVGAPFFAGLDNFFDCFIDILSRSMFLPQCYFLVEAINNKSRKSLLFSTTSAVVIAGLVNSLFLILAMLCIGNFAMTQEFPVFTLASFLDLEPLQRLDIFLGIIILTTNLVRVSAVVYLIQRLSRNLSDKYSGFILVSACSAIVILASITSQQPGLQEVAYSPILVITSGIILGILLPVISARRKRRSP